ncbi:hypothetical protein D9M71_612050 [compost metagenome]
MAATRFVQEQFSQAISMLLDVLHLLHNRASRRLDHSTYYNTMQISADMDVNDINDSCQRFLVLYCCRHHLACS